MQYKDCLLRISHYSQTDMPNGRRKRTSAVGTRHLLYPSWFFQWIEGDHLSRLGQFFQWTESGHLLHLG